MTNRVANQPMDNRVNRELCEYIARVLSVSKDRVGIAAGHKSRRKTVAVRGVGRDEAAELLRRAYEGCPPL